MKRILLGFIVASTLAALGYFLLSVIGHFAAPHLSWHPGWVSGDPFFRDMGDFGAGLLVTLNLVLALIVVVCLLGLMYQLGEKVMSIYNKEEELF